jgi:hypothetical protein
MTEISFTAAKCDVSLPTFGQKSVLYMSSGLAWDFGIRSSVSMPRLLPFHELPYLPSLSIDNVPVWSGLDFILALIPLRIRVVDPTLPVASRNAEGEMAASSLPIWDPDWRRGT